MLTFSFHFFLWAHDTIGITMIANLNMEFPGYILARETMVPQKVDKIITIGQSHEI
jgi:hypothetical protein